ncbi:hypothetical protein ACFPPA_04715 [Rhodanobacter ginsengisoli]|uniref:SMODS and SLOG-associating 2TM effector domain-containing protein n=1 Tax=Rhodanobacter ginsengisoli TaxID=418646 RepID=A0ABW0QLI1_9GAMM
MTTTASPSAPTSVPLVIGVTSHRNIPADEIEPIRRRVRQFLATLQGDFPELPLVVLSALAEGGDQLVAEEALAAGARLIAPLPLPRELYTKDFEAPSTHAVFDSLCARAQVIDLPLLPDNSHHGIGSHGLQRDRQYGQAGVFIARHCHLLLAIWDGKRSDRLGGTAQVVNYFLSGVMPGLIERRHSMRRHLFGSGDERLVCQIVCSRETDDGAPSAPLQPGQLLWRTQTGLSPIDAPMPAAFRNTFEHMAEFDGDCVKYRDEIEGCGAAGDTSRGNDAPPARPEATLFRAADWLAVHFRQRVLLAMRIIYTLAAVMAIAFTIYDNLPDQDDFIYVFLLLFASGVCLSTIAKRRGWHRKYLDYRALAEGLRVQGYWHRAGISLTGDPEFAQDSFLQKQDIELGWTRNVMRSAGLGQAGNKPDDPDRELHEVICEWVGDAAHGGQMDYFRNQAVQRTRQHHLTETLGLASLFTGIGISIVLAALAHQLSADTKNALVMVMGVFSILAAVREAYAFKKADKELIKQYRFMQRIFAEARTALDNAIDATEQRDILRSLGEAALAEHAEWALMHRQRPLEHGKM